MTSSSYAFQNIVLTKEKSRETISNVKDTFYKDLNTMLLTSFSKDNTRIPCFATHFCYAQKHLHILLGIFKQE